MSFGNAYAAMAMGKGKRRGRRRAVSLRPQTPASSQNGGHTGHFAGSMGGQHAAAPHNGQYAGGGHMMMPPPPTHAGPAMGQQYPGTPMMGNALAGRGRGRNC